MNDQLTVLSSVIPQLYYDGESNLVDILEEYYRWLDSEFIDPSLVRSIEAEQTFVDKLLEEYAPGIEKTSATNQQLLIKYATELFRAKGTPRAVELFFRLVYQVNADVSFPRDRLFSTSDGSYKTPSYVEITRSEHVDKFIHNYVITSSGGIMYVEGVHKIENRILLYVSNIVGDVSIGDAVYTTSDTRKNSSTITGSLTDVLVAKSQDGMFKGQSVEFVTKTGERGYGYVSAVDSLGTNATFDLQTQGVGISPLPEINISEQTILATSVSSTGGELFTDDSSITQELFAGTFDEINGEFTAGDTVQLEEYSGMTLIGSVDATVIAFEQTQDAGGRVIVQSNGATANVLAATYLVNGSNYGNNLVVTDVTASASVVDAAPDVNIVFTTNERPLKIGDTVYQYDGGLTGKGLVTFTPAANKATIAVEFGQFVPGIEVRNEANNVVVTPNDIEQFVGINTITNSFYPTAETLTGNTTFTATIVSEVAGSTLTVRQLNNQRTLVVTGPVDATIGSETSNYYDLSGTDYYGLSGGSVSLTRTILTDKNYDYPPIATIKQPSFPRFVYDVEVDSTENFDVDEVVVQTGIHNNTFDLTVDDVSLIEREMFVARDDAAVGVGVVDYIDPTTNTVGIRSAVGTWLGAGTLRTVSGGIFDTTLASITGVSNSTTASTASGIIISKTATVLTVVTSEQFVIGGEITGKHSGSQRDVVSATNVTTDYNNLDQAKVKGRLQRTGGRIAAVVVTHAQPGFINNQPVQIVSNGTVVGSGRAVTGPLGKAKPQFTDLGSRPSGVNNLFDGRYYQHLSYEVKTTVDVDKYPNNKQFLQLAGMEMFIHNEIRSNNSSQPQEISVEVEIVDV